MSLSEILGIENEYDLLSKQAKVCINIGSLQGDDPIMKI